MKTVFFLILVFAISGLFTIGFSDVSATHDGKGESKSKGCENGSAAEKGNPHWDVGPPPDPLQLTACDIDGDGTIDADELAAINGIDITQTDSIISSVTRDGIIDSDGEVKKLNRLLASIGLDLCI